MHSIGVIRTPFREQAGTPIQPARAGDAVGTVILEDAYTPALKDLEGFERIWLIYLFDRARAWSPLVVPYLDREPRGLFATRAPARPNPIGISAVRLESVQGSTLTVRGVDVLDGTPLLDVKPYVPEFDAFPGSRAGWFEAGAGCERLADDRFERPCGRDSTGQG